MSSGAVTFTVTDAEGQQAAVVLPYAVAGWFDDFSQGINPARWNIRNGDSAGNNYAFYIPANVTVQADGVHLTAKRQTGLAGQPTSKGYTSGYLDTVGKFSAATGLWEMVARLPTAKGLWPAFWLRCDSTLGEIDIMEAVDPLNDDVQTVHQSTDGNMDKSGFEFKPAGLDLSQFHKFGLRRDTDGTLTWLVNDVPDHVVRPTDISTKLHQPMTWLTGPTFASPLNIRLNLQVGGAMPISFNDDVDSTTVLPDDFVIRSVSWTPLS